MLDVDILGDAQLLQFQTVKEGFINAIGDTAPKCGRIVVFLNFPNSNGVDRAWEGAVDASRHGPNGLAVPGDGGHEGAHALGALQGLHDVRILITIEEPNLEANMDTFGVVVDSNLARQYLERYREVFPVSRIPAISDEGLLQAFVEDRLREELEFLNEEDNNAPTE
jgi:hypothetical protein